MNGTCLDRGGHDDGHEDWLWIQFKSWLRFVAANAAIAGRHRIDAPTALLVSCRKLLADTFDALNVEVLATGLTIKITSSRHQSFAAFIRSSFRVARAARNISRPIFVVMEQTSKSRAWGHYWICRNAKRTMRCARNQMHLLMNLVMKRRRPVCLHRTPRIRTSKHNPTSRATKFPSDRAAPSPTRRDFPAPRLFVRFASLSTA